MPIGGRFDGEPLAQQELDGAGDVHLQLQDVDEYSGCRVRATAAEALNYDGKRYCLDPHLLLEIVSSHARTINERAVPGQPSAWRITEM